jgi:hypothetical protein
MTFVLKRPVAVDPDPGRGMAPNAMLTLEAGHPLADIPKHERDQLAPDHFVDGDLVDGEVVVRDPDKRPKDWRSDERQAADVEHAKRLAAHIRGEE